MTIEIKYANSDYKIVVEPSSFTAYKLGVKATGNNIGDPTETVVGYFTSVGSAIRKIVQSELSETDEKVTLLQYADRIKADYEQLLKQTDL